MKIKINAVIDGNELLNHFIDRIKQEQNIDIPWKEGSANPVGTSFIVTKSNGEEIQIAPDKIKIVYNN